MKLECQRAKALNPGARVGEDAQCDAVFKRRLQGEGWPETSLGLAARWKVKWREQPDPPVHKPRLESRDLQPLRDGGGQVFIRKRSYALARSCPSRYLDTQTPSWGLDKGLESPGYR